MMSVMFYFVCVQKGLLLEVFRKFNLMTSAPGLFPVLTFILDLGSLLCTADSVTLIWTWAEMQRTEL